MRNVVNDLKNYNIPVISAPIFDPRMSKTMYRLAAKFGHINALHMTNPSYEFHEAAKKYKFRLVLGGSVKGAEGLYKIEEMMTGRYNISYLGQLIDYELRNYYLRAKVFALPSLSEGVEMVALEAASCGCEIVITNYGAPKEYYNGLARLVDPKSVDDIGQAVVECMERKSTGELMNHIKANYSPEHCAKLLEDAVSECVRESRRR